MGAPGRKRSLSVAFTLALKQHEREGRRMKKYYRSNAAAFIDISGAEEVTATRPPAPMRTSPCFNVVGLNDRKGSKLCVVLVS